MAPEMAARVRHPEGPSPTIRGVLKGGRFTQSGNDWKGMGEAWTSFSTILTGILLWGGVGCGLDKLFGTKPVFFVIGVLVGNFSAIYLIYVRALRQEESNRAA